MRIDKNFRIKLFVLSVGIFPIVVFFNILKDLWFNVINYKNMYWPFGAALQKPSLIWCLTCALGLTGFCLFFLTILTYKNWTREILIKIFTLWLAIRIIMLIEPINQIRELIMKHKKGMLDYEDWKVIYDPIFTYVLFTSILIFFIWGLKKEELKLIFK